MKGLTTNIHKVTSFDSDILKYPFETYCIIPKHFCVFLDIYIVCAFCFS